ncbi:uncharacterized protein cubi_01090 [Cryptosporidium ubiquitum]|uniref:Uncharacterized protein n=1 Tax=Cryptosporidium ubiquitum TaxID=857276 RepID=A0A1J4MJ75_9CRYT|nr:uncharacterized protein cubi_01090 [Cryptosporidium ubiquitum]OII74246.1 hypothetical protein cubi_01090 [Cryptosporidium ubiquitum]
MYKRAALFSSDLLANLSDNQYLRENIERQIDKVYGDDFSDECPKLSEKYSVSLLKSQNIAMENIDSVEDKFVGNFKCILCPKKIIINEVDLNKHLKSRQHLNMVEKWQKKQENSRKIREKFNIFHNLTTAQDHLDQVNFEDTKDSCLADTLKSNRKNKRKKSRNKDLSEEQIIARKVKFMRKKERRLARKSQKAEIIC